MTYISPFFLLFSTFLYLQINAEIFSAVHKLENLLKTQNGLINSLDNFIMNKKNKNKVVNSYLKTLKKEQQIAMNDTSRYLGNPITGYRLIKRLTVDLDLIEEVINKLTDFERNKSLTYPTKHDLLGAADGLLRLEATYGLNIQQLADGVWNTSFGRSRKSYSDIFTPMSVSDCFEIGKALYTRKYYAPGIKWMKEAMRKYQQGKGQDGNRITLDEIHHQINRGNQKLDEQIEKFATWLSDLTAENSSIKKMHISQIITYFKNGLTVDETLKAIADEENSDELHKNFVSQINLSPDELNATYTALCRGENTEKRRVLKRLSCYFAHGPHPFLILAPIKTERLHDAPEILLFYDVISDTEIQTILNLTKTRLVLANVYTERICQGSFVLAKESKIVASMKIRVMQLTGLSLTNSEALYVLNYGIGGYHKNHYDFTLNETCIGKQGNRLATVNFYLSDVEQGGATVFPVLDLAVFPVKGAALYWRNLYTGQGHPATLHASCPVLLGSKWVANQFISTLGQENNEQCFSKPKRWRSSSRGHQLFPSGLLRIDNGCIVNHIIDNFTGK